MSSIFYVEVTDKRGDAVSLLLVEIQFGFVFAASPTWALQLLVESWERMRDGWVETAQMAGNSGGLYAPFSPDEARHRAAASPIAPLDPDLGDEAWIRDQAPRFIRSVALGEERHAAGLRGSPFPMRHLHGPHAEAVLTVRVADPAWLDHLEPGVCWDTTAYPYETG